MATRAHADSCCTFRTPNFKFIFKKNGNVTQDRHFKVHDIVKMEKEYNMNGIIQEILHTKIPNAIGSVFVDYRKVV